MKKRITTLLLALCTMTSTSVSAFTDVTGEGKKEIDELFDRGIVKGVSETEFVPENNVTRAEFAALITRAFEIPEKTYTNQFTDVSADDWFAGAVSAMHEMGIIEGYAGKFNPYDNITHEQSCKILTLIFEDIAEEITYPYAYSSIYNDYFNVSEWARDYVAKATMLGCTVYDTAGFKTGDDKKIQLISPKEPQTRRETAICLYRVLDSVENYKAKVYTEEE
jgi:hypothetical protein